MRRCSVCGGELSETAQFCGGCGATADGTARPSQPLGDPRLAGRGLVIAGGVYLAFLVLCLLAVLTEMQVGDHWYDIVSAVVAVGGFAALGREALPPLGFPVLTGKGLLLTLISITTALLASTALSFVWPEWLSIRSLYVQEGAGFAMAIVDFCVLAPVIEELAFRGAILGGLARVFDRRAAIALSSFLFATIHLSPISFVHLFLVGALCGTLRVRSKSLYPAMLAHSAYNAVVLALDWWVL
ncbi:MAG: CPBP family intramembrane metalloprotease [Deltaproteobacteria bacterium]|nr:CPBP family intramembrane metalloprotease [Deltaproteobacteria bacterium]